MDEYIKKEDALRVISDVLFDTDPSGKEQIAVLKCSHSVRELPAADVMEVTRCKACRHHSTAAGVCNLYLHFSVGVSANDFCSAGERGSDNEQT